MAKICKKKRSWHTYGGQREWSLWAVLPWISTRNPCPIPSKISSDEDVLVNVPTHLAIPDFTAQNIPSWPPHWPWRKVHVCTVLQTSLASCQVCMWAEGEQGVGFTLDLTMPAHHTILVQQLPFPEPSCHKLAYACETSCQGRWEKTVEQKWEVRSQCASCKRNLEEKQLLLQWYLRSSFCGTVIPYPHPACQQTFGRSLAPAVFFHCPLLLSPVTCFPLHMYLHSILLLPATGKLPSWISRGFLHCSVVLI